jgi:hypothetical protein
MLQMRWKLHLLAFVQRRKEDESVDAMDNESKTAVNDGQNLSKVTVVFRAARWTVALIAFWAVVAVLLYGHRGPGMQPGDYSMESFSRLCCRCAPAIVSAPEAF